MKDISNVNVLINASGIVDSGGARVFEKLLNELSASPSHHYYIVCSRGVNLDFLMSRYVTYSNVHFITTPKKGLLYRLYYENFTFRKIISKKDIQLIYNFSGSYQFFIKIPQLVKIQNLIFFSRKLDFCYEKKLSFFVWIKQVYVRRLIISYMFTLGNQTNTHIEIQSIHVKNNLSDFININKKNFYVKSDISVQDKDFQSPKKYDFNNKVNFLYIVGPHFDVMNKNFIDFTNVMLGLDSLGINFEINITLSYKQLNNSNVWDSSLNCKTNFLGYISDQEQMTKLFYDNTILISTSIIETLGLHVIEGIKNGIITIAPDEKYANAVYGENMLTYELFNKDDLSKTIMTVINCKKSYSEKILSIQDDLRQSEMSKFSNILDVFNEVLNVQK